VTAHDPPPGPWQLLRLWAGIGFQSFGGGASTQFLIQRTFTERHTWLSPEELLHFLALCTLTPRINLIALTILIGRKLAGARGVAASLAGLLLPSAAITCLLAAFFTRVAHQPAVTAALRGVVPATAGAMLLVGLNFARPLARAAARDGSRALLASGGLVAASALAIIVVRLPVALVVVGALALGAVLFPARSRRTPEVGRDEAG
jgi:chromate transporter